MELKPASYTSSLLQMASRIARLGAWTVDLPDLRITWTREVRRLFEVDDDFQPSLETALDFYTPETRPALTSAIEACLHEGVPFDEKVQLVTARGNVLWVRVIGESVRNDVGDILRIEGAVQDISEQKAAQELLGQQSALLRMAGKVALVGGWAVYPTQEIAFTEEVLLILGFPNGFTATLRNSLALFLPHSREILTVALHGCLEVGRPFDVELELRTPSGAQRWVRCVGEAERGEEGSITRAQGALQDITDVKASQKRERQNETQLATVLEGIQDAFFIMDADWRFTYVNKQCEPVLFRSREQLLGKVIWEEFAEVAGSKFDDGYRRALREQRPVELEEYYAPLRVWFRVRAYPIKDGGLAVSFADITQQRESREALAESEQRFREFAERVNDVYYTVDSATRKILYISPAYAKVWGRSCESLIEEPLSYIEAIHPDDRAQAQASYTKHFQGKEAEVDYRILRPDGEVRYIHDRSFPIVDEAGNLLRVVGTARDITDRTLAQEQMRVSDERFRLLSKAINDPIWDWNLLDDRLWVNEAFGTFFGYQAADMDPVISAWKRRIHPDDRARVEKSLMSAIHGSADHWSDEYRYLRKDDQVVHVLNRGSLIRDVDGRPLRMIGAMIDLSESKEKAVRLSEQAALLDQASDAILVFDSRGSLLFWSKGAEAIYGWTADEVLGRPLAEVLEFAESVLQEAREEVFGSEEWTGELVQKRKNGLSVSLMARWTLVRDDQGMPKSVLAIHTDVTDRKLLEQQFLRSQRLESIGTLAGGLAHDLNNLLAPILLSTEILREYVKSEEAYPLLEAIRTSANRGAELIKRVLGFAKGVEGQRTLLDPGEMLGNIEQVLRETLPRSIDFQLHADPGVWAIEADPTQLHQVLMNLCVNARDAMPEGGELKVGLENVVVDDLMLKMNAEARPGTYVKFAVEDTGTGMSAEVQARIYEPFFTTKEFGAGTGLGLSTTFSIVRSHRGFLQLYSEPGRGTTFKVYLPAQAGAKAAELFAVENRQMPLGRGELILLVDDEEQIRQITSQLLRRSGYRVIVAENGHGAIASYLEHSQDLALVLTDMSMPGMDGPALITALKRLAPDLPIVCSSGLPVDSALIAQVAGFVPKPYSADALLKTLRDVLPDTPADVCPLAEESARALPPAGEAARVPGEPTQLRTMPLESAHVRETILVVDDIEALAKLAKQLLERKGFRVLTAFSGERALQILLEEKGGIDLLLTDVRMPDMSGIELALLTEERYPWVKIVFVSGGGLATDLEDRYPVLHKPYTPADLARSVKDVLKA